MVRMLDNIVGKSDAPIVAELPRRSPIVRAANEDGSYTMSDGHRHTLRAEAPPSKHFDAHHGVAGEPGLFGCDECGRTWPTRPPLDPRTAK
ncbi:hypothetical protein [Promicromonospora kroppenstedtii]|uniref:hypothetical protein n=1 Tax=Promicromonospora kroppenstedtii TaxID=440482 RepID=UPI00055CA5C8|nr:hypothetical protein [Promicromonospora kroppenstedtii]